MSDIDILEKKMVLNGYVTYDRSDVLKASIEYFDGDEMAANVWINKYALKDSTGNLYELTPDDMHKRIAKEFARIESNHPNPISYEDIYDRIKNFSKIIPQGSPMAGIGNEFQIVSLSNCFVIGNEGDYDSYGGIMKLDQELVQLMKRRAGVGLDLSFIRPSGSPVKNSALVSTGIVPYMERYSNSTREVAQDGRRGALMESISIIHPDAEQFIDAKIDETKVTGANVSVRMTDEFMESVFNGKMFMAKYPVESNNPTFTKEVNPKVIWDKIIHNAWDKAEPGVLFWDTIIRESIPDCYSDLGFKSTSTNPCIVGNTLVAVADGRNAVSIKQLAEEGKDVPVYCYNDNGKLCIRIMRNPRITGYEQQIYKVTLDDGSVFRTTKNHKVRLKSGEYKEVKDLIYGDSLQLLTKYEASIKDIFPKANSNSQDYFWFKKDDLKTPKSEHRLIAEFTYNEKIPNGYVVHHIDHNAKNNRPNNLEIMSKYDHDILHSKNMIGDKNPMRRAKTEWSDEKWESYSKNMSKSVSGELNGKFSGYSNEDLKKAAIELTTKLQRRFTVKEWEEYAKENGLPQYFSGWRKNQLNGGIMGFSKWAAMELGFDKHIDVDPRIIKSYSKLISEGYDTEIIDGNIIINKLCEECSKPMQVKWNYREISKCCTTNCYNKQMWSNDELKNKISETRNNTEKIRKEKIAQNQIKIYSDLKFKLGRDPMLKEWILECKDNNISGEVGRKSSPIRNWGELKDVASNYNHKVISVEIDNIEDVYNGTVDEFHNFFTGHFEGKTENGKYKWSYINQLQCGEIILCNEDSCRLLALNLYSYITNPFTKEAYFNYKEFEKDVIIAQRLMDDLVDLELEKIDKILDKIESDPEPDYLKYTEKNLWLNIKKKCMEGRRTGLGITAEGDMLAALGIRYGTDAGNDFSEDLHRKFKLFAYRSSVTLAKERGAFSLYDTERELNNPFINRIKDDDKKLYDDMVKYGRRNIAILTIAPTGTVSFMTQTTSGIEPAFSLFYTRRVKINPNDENVKNKRVDFVDKVGDSWQEYPVFHHKFRDYLIINGYDMDKVNNMSKAEIEVIIEHSPYYKATANDVDWVKKVEMQGRIQKHIDHSISVTVNLPKTVTEELVSKVYETAWRSGCKGITIYRDGSRSGVLITIEEENKITKTNAVKRPKTLDCDIYHVTTNSEQWMVIVGLLGGEPYEVFAIKPKSIHIPQRIRSGKLTKIKRGQYDLDCDGFIIENLVSHFESNEQEALTRMISTSLRHGVDIQFVVEQLNKSEGTIVSFSKAIARTLKKYIDESNGSTETCANCGEKSLVYQEGCLSCTNCGTSKCG